MQIIDIFPNRLKEAMHGRSVTSLASDAGVSKQTISAYLGGTRKPKRLMLAELARILNVSEAWLVGYDVPKERCDESTNTTPPSPEEEDVFRTLFDQLSPEDQNEIIKKMLEMQKK